MKLPSKLQDSRYLATEAGNAWSNSPKKKQISNAAEEKKAAQKKEEKYPEPVFEDERSEILIFDRLSKQCVVSEEPNIELDQLTSENISNLPEVSFVFNPNGQSRS